MSAVAPVIGLTSITDADWVECVGCALGAGLGLLVIDLRGSTISQLTGSVPKVGGSGREPGAADVADLLWAQHLVDAGAVVFLDSTSFQLELPQIEYLDVVLNLGDPWLGLENDVPWLHVPVHEVAADVTPSLHVDKDARAFHRDRNRVPVWPLLSIGEIPIPPDARRSGFAGDSRLAASNGEVSRVTSGVRQDRSGEAAGCVVKSGRGWVEGGWRPGPVLGQWQAGVVCWQSRQASRVREAARSGRATGRASARTRLFGYLRSLLGTVIRKIL